MNTRRPSTLHRESHAELLSTWFQPPTRIARPRIDAIIVPTIRPASYLVAAAELAAQVGCLLVVLCTARAIGGTVRELARGRSRPRTAVIGLPVEYEHRLLRFSTSRHPDAGRPEHIDLSTKRNLGLLMANMLGWRQVLFLDDDMQGLTASQVARASLRLERYRAVGFLVRDYPDNSVVCHAHRLTGADQDNFIGGSPLLVDVATARSFFPAVYNEDWLFLYDSLSERAVTAAGMAEQLPYDPYGTTARADAEEFGDVIGEGLFRLLHRRVHAREAEPTIWQDLLHRRRQFIEQILERLLAIGDGTDDPRRADDARRAMKALTAAKDRLDHIEARACDSFVKQWRSDLVKWSERILKLPRFTSIRKALRHLELPLAGLEGPRCRQSEDR
jgi:hypothetical protein